MWLCMWLRFKFWSCNSMLLLLTIEQNLITTKQNTLIQNSWNSPSYELGRLVLIAVTQITPTLSEISLTLSNICTTWVKSLKENNKWYLQLTQPCHPFFHKGWKYMNVADGWWWILLVFMVINFIPQIALWILHYLGSFNTNYILFRIIEIFTQNVFFKG
jgi:hypothetical protein